MYEAYYGFREKPFSLVPDPDFLYLGRHHRAALNILEYGLRGEASFALISGEVGSGKTILIRRFLRMVDHQTTVGLITNTHASLGNMLDWILLAFNLDYRGKEKVELFEILTNFLREQRAHGRRTVLIIDEAQNMELEMLEELRMLSNINVDKELMFQIVLAGQPEILDKINRPELRQLAQRISANFHLSPLTLDETRDYVCHRLVVAGGRWDLFDNLACAGVYHFTQGLPRPINILCDAALVYAFGEERETIDLDTILDVVEDVQRSGLRALKSLEQGFDRERFKADITALAETYVHDRPPEEDIQSSETAKAKAPLPKSEPKALTAEPSGSEDAAARQEEPARPDGPRIEVPRALGPAVELPKAETPRRETPRVEEPKVEVHREVPAALRDVPAGIPPLLRSRGHDDQRHQPQDGASAGDNRLRLLFDVAAAAIVVVVGAVTLLKGLDVWTGPVSPDEAALGTTAGLTGAAPGTLDETPDSSITIPLGGLSEDVIGENGLGEDGLSEVDQHIADLLEQARAQTAEAARLTTGDQAAYETYHKILAIRPDYQPALDGLRELDEKRLEIARLATQEPTATEQNEPEAAEAPPAPPAPEPEAEPVQTAALPPASAAGAEDPTASEDRWVRLGTFRLSESVPIMWGRLQRNQTDLLGELSHRVTKVAQGEHDTLYLLEAGPLTDIAASRALCRDLAARGVDCISARELGESGAPTRLPQTAVLVETPSVNPAPAAPAPASLGNATVYQLALVHSQNGESHAEKGEYDEAIREFNEAIRLNPGLAATHYSRGEIYFQRGDYEDAIRDFTQTIRLAPDYTFAYYSRGVANVRTGEIEEAILDFTHTVRLKPSYAPAYNDRARALYSLGHLREALRDSELAVSVAPNTPSYLTTHSLILAALGRNEGAFATLEQAMTNANAEWIKKYQQAMTRDGYYQGPIDGQYGPATKSAMRACLVSGCSMADWN